jgi:hypothetical protein
MLAACDSHITPAIALQGGYADADMGLVDLTAALVAAESGGAGGVAAAADDFLQPPSLSPPHGDSDSEELPAASDGEASPPPPGVDLVAAAAAAAGAGTQAAAAVRPPSKQENALQPQCAMVAGAALGDAPEVSTLHWEPLPPREPSQQCQGLWQELQAGIIPPAEAGISWDHFPNHLGEGIRSRLLALATLHLGAGAGACPAAVRELPANSNRVLLGAALNCELYQERVIRWVVGASWGSNAVCWVLQQSCFYGCPLLPDKPSPYLTSHAALVAFPSACLPAAAGRWRARCRCLCWWRMSIA